MNRANSFSPFNPRHENQYAVKVHSRSPSGKVTGVECQFCTVFGRQKAVSTGRVAKSTRKVSRNFVFSKNFRSDLYISHHRNHHQDKWGEYQQLSDDESHAFFKVEVPFAETIPAFFSMADERMYVIDATVIDSIIYTFFAGKHSQGIRHSVQKILSIQHNDTYKLMITNVEKFQMCVSFVSSGQSFRQAVHSARTVMEVGHNANMNGVTEHTVRQYVQATICINLQRIRHIILDKRCWAFSIAFDTATNRNETYIEVRIRLFSTSKIVNLHVTTIPLHEVHTGLEIFNHVSALFQGICSDTWRHKLISVATDGASNMHGSIKGAVSRFDKETLPGFYRVWCMAHQLDLVIRHLMQSLLQESFHSSLSSLITYLRRQTSLTDQVGSTCPLVCATRWSSLGSATQWIFCHRTIISEFLCERNPSLHPDPQWWIFLATVRSFMNLYDECLIAIQGRDTIIPEQNARLEKLTVEIRDTVGILSPLSVIDLLTIAGQGSCLATAEVETGTFAICEQAVVRFLEDLSGATNEDLNNCNELERQDVLHKIAEFFLQSFLKFKALFALRTARNERLTDAFPAILPHQLYHLRPK